VKKNLFVSIIITVLILLTVEAFSRNRVVERSSRQRPAWVDGVQVDYIIALGSGQSIDVARQNAMIRVKEMIVNSVATNVRTRAGLTTEQVNDNNVFQFLETFTSQTLTQSADLPYLQGISISRVDDYYWEIIENRNTRVRTVYYHVKYPFPRFEMMVLIDEFVRADRAMTRKLDNTIAALETFSTVEELVQYIRELDHMTKTFTDRRKNKADLALIKARSMLGSIQLIEVENIPGQLVYKLQLGSRILTASANPAIRSNCAVVNSVLPINNSTEVKFNYENCYADEDNRIVVAYRFENTRIENTFYFDIKQFATEIFVGDDIFFRALERQGEHITQFECLITVFSKYENPFFIDRIVLNFGNQPPVIFDDLELKLEGKGAHRITLTGHQSLKAAEYRSNQDNINLLSGSITYGSMQTREPRIYRIFNQTFFTDW